MFRQRAPQLLGHRGSLKWIQRLVDGNPSLLTDAIRTAIARPAEWNVTWRSPLRDDDWAEYRDEGMLLRLDLPQLTESLSAFWPSGGAQWDGLGITSDGGCILVEAKAHVAELSSSCGAGEKSLVQIRSALDATKPSFGATSEHDWINGYYQYANRLAHLDFLRRSGVDAHLVLLYCVGDSEMSGPESTEEWQSHLSTVYTHLGLQGDMAARGVVNVFLPVALITD